MLHVLDTELSHHTILKGTTDYPKDAHVQLHTNDKGLVNTLTKQ